LASVHIMKDGEATSFEINPLRAASLKVDKVIKAGGYALVLGKNGRLYSLERFPTRQRAYYGFSWRFTMPFAKALHRLKKISDKDLADTLARHERDRFRTRHEHELAEFEALAKSLKIKLTVAQKKAIRLKRKNNRI